eukprot:253115_1
MDIEVDSQDVIKVVLQFLKENNLYQSMQALQQETNVSLNVVDNLDELLSYIHTGRWNKVLEITSSISVPSEVLFDLFEQILFELVEMNEIDSARSLLFNSQPLIAMKNDEIHNIRYCRLQQIVNDADNNRVNLSQLYGYGANKEQRRKHIAEQMQKEVFEVAPSRLLSLVQNALKYEQISGQLMKGQTYDLFRDYEAKTKDTKGDTRDRNEMIVRKNTSVIPFSKHSAMTYITFSRDGNLLVSGSSDGFIEVWDYDKGELMKDSNVLSFQWNDELLLHNENEAVRYITFSNDSQSMASGGDNGSIKIWNIYRGINSITFNDAHAKSITSLQFNKNGTQILSSSLDGLIKIHGLKSQRILKEFNGHSSFVNKALYINNDESIVSCSSDGSIRIWDTKTTQCVHQIHNIHQMVPQNITTAMKQYLNEEYASLNKDQSDKTTGNISIRTMVANPMNKKTKQEEVYVILGNDWHVVYLLNVKTG